ncbi:hypothetical protein IAT40_003910 [Kwoniella sp. CBS 6097]
MATKKIRSANAASMSTLAPGLPVSDKLKDGRRYTISLVDAESLSSGERDTIYTIFDDNMSYLQQTSSFPYTESSKREELFHPDTRYLLVRSPASPSTSTCTSTSISTSTSTSMPSLTSTITENIINPLVSLATGKSSPSSNPTNSRARSKSSTNSLVDDDPETRRRAQVKNNALSQRAGKEEEDSTILGYCSFRFDTEETLSPRDAEVIYCYELQLSPSLRGQGLGKILINHLVEIGRRRGLDKSMLTCLKRNKDALSFYSKQGYHPDEIDPTRMTEEEEWADEGDEDGEDEADGDGDEHGSEDRQEVDYVILSKSL